ncbi:MAG TPA: ABC transporter substrate-binding protein [Syntrophomonadaceae bacterium]|nr:ABC transporter substrate-binding protein [Syntrophomonadaceae bacterium]HNX29907.1 ABC transporter substrate-binding protein [Syntrophomonadaceae bacterium]HPR94547.1 ABC transporter substrate-binding protein [Syntrophomonadaceae bacterium]
MKRTRKLSISLLILVCFSFVLIGCGQKDQTDNSLQRVKDAGEISFSMSGGYPPFNYYNDQNQLVGFDIDVCNEVAKRLGVEFKPVPNEWSGIIEGLRSGVYDGILGSMAITEEREEVVNFSIPYYYSGAQLLVHKDSSYNAPEELAGKDVGLVTGTTFENDANKLNAEIKLYKDDNQTLMELQNKNLDAVITDRVVGISAINNGEFDIRLLGNPLRSEDIAVAFRQEDDALREAVNEILQEMHDDGTLTQLSTKWLNVDISVK